MSYNTIGPLPKKSYASSEEVKKEIRGLDDIKKPLVTNFDTVDKEGPIDTVDKEVYRNLMRWTKPSILQFYQKRIFTKLKK